MTGAPESGRPLVTVLLPVYNGAAHIRESIDSLLGQSFRDFELLLVDDGSTDETPSILEGYGDERVRILVNERNVGLTATLNRGISAARGAYIARQDADDLSDPGRLAAQVEHLEANPQTALLGTSYRRIDESGRPQGTRPVPSDPTAIRWRLLFLSAFAHSSVMIRAAALEEVGPYDERYTYAQDYELWSRIARTHRVEAIPEPLVSYRRTGSSLTATYDRADDEVEEISAANIAWILDRAGSERRDIAELDRETAWQLLFGDPRALDPAAARSVAPLILDLQRAFATAYGLEPEAARRHRRETARRLSSELGRLGLRGRDPGAIAAAGRIRFRG